MMWRMVRSGRGWLAAGAAALALVAAQAGIAAAQTPDDASINLCDQQSARYVEAPDGGLIPVAQENCAVVNTDNGVAVVDSTTPTVMDGGAAVQTNGGVAVTPTGG